MSTAPLRVLLLDDSEDDYVITRELITEAGRDWARLQWTNLYDEAVAAIEHGACDVCLLDYRLTGRSGLDLLGEATRRGWSIPIIVLTGTGGYDIDVQAMKQGAADYLVKDTLTAPLLERSVRYACERARDLAALRESEERFRWMADTAPVLIWLADPDGAATFFNRRWLEFTGRSLEAERGAGWLSNVHPEDRDRCVALFQAASDERRLCTVEYRLRRADGEYRWMLDTAMPRFRADGSFAGFIGSCVDITERKLAETEIQRARNYAESMIASSLDMIVTVDHDRRIHEFNQAAQDTYGYTKAEALNMSCAELCADEVECEKLREAVLRDGRFRGEINARRRNGELFPTLMSASLLRDPDGEVVGVLGVSRDITDIKAARDKLEHSLRLVERSREDLLLTLNQLRLGVVMVDPEGKVTFLSENCQQLVGPLGDDYLGRHWPELCPFNDQDKRRIEAAMSQPPDQRSKISIRTTAPDGRSYWMEVEVKDDPRDPRSRILFMYDITELHDLRRMLDEKAQFHDLVGKSAPMQALYQQIRDLAKVDSTVLVEGETGTGKELVARAIHAASRRRDNPFVAVNCAGLTDSLLASQLFGHRRGAFTGAVEDAQGVFETANGGTVFLDEIGDISRTMQTSLLRVLQEKEITRVGEVRPRQVDVRILTATHRDLNTEVEQGRFRMDLLYRVRVARVLLPLLRDRREDIPLLAEAFLRRFRAASGKPVDRLSEEAMGRLLDHDWPGNVRELQSAIEFGGIHCRGAVITASDLPPELISPRIGPSTGRDSRDADRARILAALSAVNGNRASAARLLGWSRSTLYRRLNDLQIETK